MNSPSPFNIVAILLLVLIIVQTIRARAFKKTAEQLRNELRNMDTHLQVQRARNHQQQAEILRMNDMSRYIIQNTPVAWAAERADLYNKLGRQQQLLNAWNEFFTTGNGLTVTLKDGSHPTRFTRN